MCIHSDDLLETHITPFWLDQLGNRNRQAADHSSVTLRRKPVFTRASIVCGLWRHAGVGEFGELYNINTVTVPTCAVVPLGLA